MIKLKIRYYLVILFYISIYSIKAQEQQSDTVKIGGTYRHYNANIEPRVLDKATFSVIYRLKHQVINDKEIYFLIDTMQLVSGSNVSIYYDRNVQSP